MYKRSDGDRSVLAKVRNRLHSMLELTDPDDSAVRSFNLSMTALIFLNVLSVILETMPELEYQFSTVFALFEVVSIGIFTIEYLSRLWACIEDTRYQVPVWGRLRYMLTAMSLVDLLSILPFYIPLVIPLDLRVLRALRLFRVFRLLKLGRHTESLSRLARVLRHKRGELTVTVTALAILLILASSAMFYAENSAQPKVFSSIPAAMWWGVVTLTTVGYGDIYPVTPLGKVIGAIIALLGIGLFALPAGIFASGFADTLKEDRVVVCPKCGQEIDIE
jgi:voltage-gated potassium channel